MDFFNDLLAICLLVVCGLIIGVFMKDFMILGRKREKEEQIEGTRLFYSVYSGVTAKSGQKKEIVSMQEVDLKKLPVRFGSSDSADIVISSDEGFMEPAPLIWFTLIMADDQLIVREGRGTGGSGHGLRIREDGQTKTFKKDLVLEKGKNLELRSGDFAVVLKPV